MQPPPDPEVNPAIRWLAGAPSFLTSLLSCTVGIALFIVPDFVLGLHSHDVTITTALEVTLARITGGLFLSVSFSSLLMVALSLSSSAPITNCRASLRSHAMLGLLLVLVSMINFRVSPSDNDHDDQTAQSVYLLIVGTLVLILSCIGLMVSFVLLAYHVN